VIHIDTRRGRLQHHRTARRSPVPRCGTRDRGSARRSKPAAMPDRSGSPAISGFATTVFKSAGPSYSQWPSPCLDQHIPRKQAQRNKVGARPQRRAVRWRNRDSLIIPVSPSEVKSARTCHGSPPVPPPARVPVPRQHPGVVVPATRTWSRASPAGTAIWLTSSAKQGRRIHQAQVKRHRRARSQVPHSRRYRRVYRPARPHRRQPRRNPRIRGKHPQVDEVRPPAAPGSTLE
jgi:hypothetical protein